MKKILSIILALALLITTLIVSFAGVSAEEQKINRLLAFGDSVVFGDSKISNPMNDQKCGDQQFANLIAQEYALPYIKDNSDTTTSGRWYRKYAHNGAIMKNEEYLNPTYGSILNQVTNCPTDVIAAADTIVMDGGINDVGKAIGINFSNKGYPQGCTDEMYPQGVKTDIQGFTLSEMETFVDTLKNMTETDISYYTWQAIKKNIVDGYKEVMDTLLEKGFNGTIYMQNNINPFTEGKDNENSDKMVYYWDSMINYFITDSINTTIEAYPEVDIKLVDLSGFDLSNIYGIRVRFANAKDGGYSNVIFSTDNKQLYWNHGNSKSLDYVSVSSNEICGIKSSPYLTTIGRNTDFKKLENLTISSGVSDDAIYIDDIEVFTNDTSLPTPELRTVISSESEVAYENFYMTYDPNTDNAIHVGSVGSESFCNHAIKYQGGNNNFLRLQTKSQLFTNPGGFTDLKIIWDSYPAYDLTSGTYKLVAFVVPSGTSGTFSFTQCEDGNAYSSGAVLINSVDFSTATPIATYDNGAAKAYEIGEFTIVNGDTDKTLIKFDRVSDGAQLMLHGLAAVPADSEYPTTTTTTTSSSTTTTTTTTQAVETTSSSATTITAPAVSDATYENFFYLYDNNGIGTQSHWEDSGTAGKYFSNNAHGMFFPGTTALKLKVKTGLNYDESTSCLNIDWSNVTENNYFLPSAKYKLIVFEYVPKGIAGTYKFSAYEMSQSATYLSGAATELKTVDFANDTPYASYCNGKVLTFDIGEFELKDGASNAIYLTADKVSGNTLYCCGVAAVPVNPIAKMEAGAEIRLNSENGIRFLTRFDASQIQKLQSEGAQVELGTLIAPKNYLQNEDKTYKDLTFDLDEGQYVDVKYQAKDKDGNFIWHKGIDGQIAGSLVTIKDTNISREFIGRGYVKVTKDGNTTITYADYQSVDGGEPSMENHFRSLQYVAQKIKNDTTQSDIYEQFKERIDAWAKGEPAPKA